MKVMTMPPGWRPMAEGPGRANAILTEIVTKNSAAPDLRRRFLHLRASLDSAEGDR